MNFTSKMPQSGQVQLLGEQWMVDTHTHTSKEIIFVEQFYTQLLIITHKTLNKKPKSLNYEGKEIKVEKFK